MSAEENCSVVRGMFDALSRSDWAAIGQHPGLHETLQRHPTIRAAFPDLQYTIEEEMAEGDLVAMRVNVHGTHLGPFMGLPPTGKQISYSVIAMDRVQNGRIVGHWANPDFLSLLAQLGLTIVPASPTASEAT